MNTPLLEEEAFRPSARSQAAFSLIELLVVAGLMLVLIAAFIGSGARDKAATPRARSAGNLQTLQVALQIFAQEHDGLFPTQPGATHAEAPLAQLVPKSISTLDPFLCPGTGREKAPANATLERAGTSYAYYMGHRPSDTPEVILTDAQVNTAAKAPGALLFSPDGRKPGNNHRQGGGNLLFTDGRVESVSGASSPIPLPLPPDVVLLNPKSSP